MSKTVSKSDLQFYCNRINNSLRDKQKSARVTLRFAYGKVGANICKKNDPPGTYGREITHLMTRKELGLFLAGMESALEQ